MKRKINRLVSFFLALSLILSLVTVAIAAPSATDVVTTPTGYTSASDVQYKTENGYIVNWGARGEDCTFLSSYAQDFYTTGYSYEELAALEGGTSSTAPSSALYAKLNTLMSSKHTQYTSYRSDALKAMYAYTDCVNNDTSKVSLLYLGDLVSSTWDNGSTFNQEHMWPKSKLSGSNSTDIGDIMHLRAANPSENTSRNNTAYGESSGYYDPGVSIRGDCARTVLYMYVRWGNTGYMWGTSGVMENLDVLLKWNEEDPVDTWEMGRNDAVQSITGTRNVFVDYPELAYDLFNTEIPANLTTPSSGEAESTGGVAKLVTDAATLASNDKIIIVAADYNYALSTTQNGNNRGQAEITKTTDSVAYGEDTQVITLVDGTVSGTFGFEVGDESYLYAASSSSNYLRSGYLSDDGSWTIAIDADTNYATITAQGANTHNLLKYNTSSKIFSCYTSGQKDVLIYKVEGKHVHEFDAGVVTAPTCTEKGFTTYTCSCGYSYDDNEVDATGHSYVDGVCTGCGEAEPVTSTATLATNLGQLTVGSQIIIAAGGEYNVALSTTQNGNNRGQAVIVKNDNTITYGEDAQVITLEAGLVANTFAFNVGEGYLYAASSGSNHLKTQTTLNENGSWLITFADGVPSIVAQGSNTHNILRYNSSSGIFSCYGSGQLDVSIYVLPSGSTHEHKYTEVVTAPTCTAEGYTTYTCECGASYQDNFTDMVDHNYVGGVCSACGEKETAPIGWIKVQLSDISASDRIAITMTKDGTTWAIPNSYGTSTPPIKVVTVDGNTMTYSNAEEISWNIVSSEEGLVIYKYGDDTKYLYSTNSNNGIRVGTNENMYWTLDSNSGYLMNIATSRYLGVYNAQDWRAYTNTTGNTANQTLSLWKYSEAEAPVCTHENVTTTTVDATCEAAGSITVTCDDCGKTISEETIAALGHNYVDGTCSVCGAADPNASAADYSGMYYIATVRTADGSTYQYMTSDLGTASTKRYQAVDSGLTALPASIASGEANKTFVLAKNADGTYTIQAYGIADGYLGWTSGNSGNLVAADSALNLTVTKLDDGTFNITFVVDTATRELSLNSTASNNYFAFYTGTQLGDLALIPVSEVAGDVACTHENLTTTTLDATCDTAGSVTVTCDDCGEVLSVEVIEPTGHSYVNGVCSVCGAKDPDYVEVVVPTITLKTPTLLLEDTIKLNIYYTIDQDIALEKMGMLTWSSKPDVVDIATAENVYPGATFNDGNGFYGVNTDGIPAQNLGDTIYFCIYAELADGSIAYGKQVQYSPVTYAYNQINGGASAEMKALLVAILNYGAAAQTYLEDTDALVNANLTDEAKALVEAYRSDMVHSVAMPSASKQGAMASNGGFSAKKPSISLDGAFSINYYFTPSATVKGNMTFYYWNAEDFANASVLSASNATGSAVMTNNNGEYSAAIEGIAAKDVDGALYACGVYTDANGNTYSTGILPYSLGIYCGNQAKGEGALADLAAAIAVYGYYASIYFAM